MCPEAPEKGHAESSNVKKGQYEGELFLGQNIGYNTILYVC